MGCAVGWEGWSFGFFGSLRWISAVEEVGKTKAQPVALGCVGRAGVSGLGSLRWKVRWKRSSPEAQPVALGCGG